MATDPPSDETLSPAAQTGMAILSGDGGAYLDCEGWIIALSSGVTVVPFRGDSAGWGCVVVASSNEHYQVGGYHLFVTHRELAAGERIRRIGTPRTRELEKEIERLTALVASHHGFAQGVFGCEVCGTRDKPRPVKPTVNVELPDERV